MQEKRSITERVRGLRVRDRKRQAGRDVLNLLPSTSEIQWSTLAEKAKAIHMSKATLSLHLKEFTRIGKVIRRVDNSTYPPKVFYKKTSPEVLMALELSPARIIDELERFPEYLNKLQARDPKLAKQIFESLFKFLLLYQGVRLSQAFSEVTSMKTGEDILTYLRMVTDYEIGPDIEWLGALCWGNSDVAHEAVERVLDQYIDECLKLEPEIVQLVERGSALIKKQGLHLRLIKAREKKIT